MNLRRLLLTLFSLVILAFPTLSASATSLRTIQAANYSINAYYQDLFTLTGMEWRKPEFLYLDVDEEYDGECGRVTNTDQIDGLAFYCPADEVVVLEADWMAQLELGVDEFMPMFILAHEYAHHAQNLSGIEREYIPTDGDNNEVYSIENELMADCLAGSWAAHLKSVGALDRSDMAAVLLTMTRFGDQVTPPEAPGAHGSALERAKAALTGYESGALGCMAMHPLPRGLDT